jgi:hypothetical protein
MNGSITISGLLIGNAYRAYERCIQDRLSGKLFTTDDNNYSPNAIDVYILSVSALEAFINEVCFSGPEIRMINGTPAPRNLIEDLELRKKYYLLPLLLWGKTYERGVQPYQEFEMLVRIRNDLIHYKMRRYHRGDEPQYFKILSERGALLVSPHPDADFAWVMKILTSKGALWAYNTACRMAKRLIELADEQTQMVWRPMLGNFKEIPDDYWRKLVGKSTQDL